MGNKTIKAKEPMKEVEKEKTKKEEQKIPKNTFSFIILGCSESGKSTFFKHLRILFSNASFLVKEEFTYTNYIHSNIIYSMNMTFQYLKKENIEISSEFQSFFKELTQITQLSNIDSVASQYFTDDFYEKTLKFWNNQELKQAFYKCKTEYHIPDGTEYFLNNLERLKPNYYKPKTLDFLHCRKKTMNLQDINFSVEIEKFCEYKFKFFDIGGESKERSKWEKHIEKNIIIFFISLSDFDQKVVGKESENRMMESIKVFDGLVNGFGKDKPMILIFNKMDVLKEKLKTSNLKNTFQDYEGGDDLNQAIIFIQNKFLSQVKNDIKRIHSFKVNSIDRESINQCFSEILTLLVNGEIK